MIQWVYEGAQSAKLLDRIIVATDDERIYQAAEKMGAEVQMTSPDHNSGTDRVGEVAKTLSSSIVINIQGDEPLIRAEMIDALVIALQDESIPMATLAFKVNDLNFLHENTIVKVVTDNKGYALYFSRSPLPFQATDFFMQHIGIYAYQKDILLSLIQIPSSRLEKTENLEQLRALENGYRIRVLETQFSTLHVDSPKDIIQIENFLKKRTND